MAKRRVLVSADRPPKPIVSKLRGRVSPATAFDDELLQAYPDGSMFDLVPRWTSRSVLQNRLYWKILGAVVEATGSWATSAHLHESVKVATGYYREGVDLVTGEIRRIPDSTAFDRMDAAEFKAFFDAAMRALADHLGTDPMEILKR